MIRRLFLIFVNLLLVISLLPMLGCSSGPSSSTGVKFLRQRINNQSKGRIKLVSFSKTNGQEMAPMGVPSYKLDYEAEIEFLEDCRWGTASGSDWRGDFYVFEPEPGPGFSGDLYPPFRRAAKDTHTKVTASLIFQKTEAGWVGVDEPIY
jgi:hypothetical protein